MTQIDRLIRAIEARKNPTVVGLDTKFEQIPDDFAAAHSSNGRLGAILDYNCALIDALCDIVPAVKIQIACYEMLGPEGIVVLDMTMRCARQHDMVVMLDAKRGDIGSTAEAYAAAYIAGGAPLAADFLTVNPYFGTDGVKPFVDACAATGNGLFMLAKTSNPSSAELQDLKLADGRTMFEAVADKIAEWGSGLVGEHGYSSVGAVVGATHPEQGAALRRRLPRTFFLVPGYGAQGATSRDLAGCFDDDGGGAIVNASRSILCAHKKAPGRDAVSAARDEALRMRDDLWQNRRH